MFPDKESIFDSVIRRMSDLKLAEVGNALTQLDDPNKKLLTACLDRGHARVDLAAAAHPDAVDMFDLRFPAVCQSPI